MNELIIPKGTQWYLDKIMTCAPDNTVVYGAKKDLVIIYPIQPDTPPNIKCIYSAHKDQITAVAVNSNWNQPEKLAVSIGEDGIVRLWNIADCTFKMLHNAHMNSGGFGIGITFINSTITSITDNCHIVVWCLRTNSARILNLKYQMNFFRITCLSTCPHNCDLSAVGTNKGIIFVINTKGTGSILYKLRGHDCEVVSLSWCPSPFNVFNNKTDDKLNLLALSKVVSEFQTNTSLESGETTLEMNKNISLFDKYFENELNINDYSFEESNNKVIRNNDQYFEMDSVFVNNLIIPERTSSKIKKPIDKSNPWGNLEFSDEEENNELEIAAPTNFLSESAHLKKLIIDMNKEVEAANFDMNALKDTLYEISKNQIENDTKITIEASYKEEHSKSDSNEVLEEQKNIEQSIQSDTKLNSESSNEIEKVSERDFTVDKECSRIPSKDADDSVLDTEDVDSVSDLDCGFGERARSYEELSDVSKLLCTVEDIIEKSKFRESKLSASISSSLNVEINDTSVIEDDNLKIEDSSFNVESENFQKSEMKIGEDENVEDCNSNINRSQKLRRVLTGTSVETLASNDENDTRLLLDSKYCSTSISSSLHVEVDELSIASDGNVKTEETDSLKSPNITNYSDFKREQTDNLASNDEMFVKDMLLVSACKRSQVCIWRAGGDGRLQTSLNLNPKQNKYRKNNSGSTFWTSVCWVKPSLILMSSPSGELLSWNISSKINVNKSKPYQLIHSNHRKSLYCIAASCSASDQIDTPLYVWTLGQDRWLLCSDLENQIVSLPVFWGYVYFIAACPLDPHKIAVAVGDQSLRLLDLSSPHNLKISMRVIFQNVKGKVMAVAWHPEKENCLAFSTHEGRVEIFDCANLSKDQPVQFHLYHRKSVYSLCWGPLSSKSNKWVLYTCADGICVIYDPQKPNEVPTKLKVSSIKNRKVSEIAWNSDYDKVAFGFQDGSIMLATPDFESIINFYDNKKSIQHLCWHPNCTINDDGESQFKHWLATASSDSVIIVYDCQINANEDVLDKKVAVLKGHTMAVYKLAWSPHEGGQLVSVSLDGTALVWDVRSETLLSTFMGHNGDAILSVLWSPFKPDLILTGGKDCTLRIWDKSKYPPTAEKPKINKLHTKSNTKIILPSGTALKMNNKGKTETIGNEGNKKQISVETEITKTKLSKSALLPLTSKQQNLQGEICIDACKRLLNKIDERIKAREVEKSETWGDAECTIGENVDLTNNSVDHLKLFGTRDDMNALLNSERSGHERYGRWELYNNISLWKSDIKSMINNSVDKKILTDWHLSMAAPLGRRFWEETCSEYAEQLIEQNEPIKAVSYLLACNKVPHALEVLCEAKLYREALAIARCRLVHDDSEIDMILKKWAEDAEFMGSYQIAAECYICLENFEEAARIFAKKEGLNSQKLALDLAKRSNNKDLINMLEGRLKTECKTDEEISDKNTNVNDIE